MGHNFERVEAEVQREVKSRMCHHYRSRKSWLNRIPCSWTIAKQETSIWHHCSDAVCSPAVEYGTQ